MNRETVAETGRKTESPAEPDETVMIGFYSVEPVLLSPRFEHNQSSAVTTEKWNVDSFQGINSARLIPSAGSTC